MRGPSHAKVLATMRTICLRRPGTEEVLTWGHPTFRVGGKPFAVLEEYRGRLCMVFKTTPRAEQLRLVRRERFFEAPYIGKRGWVSMILDRPTPGRDLKPYLERSYRLVAKATLTTPSRKPTRRRPRNRPAA